MIAQIVLVVAGLWLMVAPPVLGYDGAPATSDRIAAPLLIAFAFLAVFRITRGLRWANLPVGAWLVVGPFMLGSEPAAAASSLVVGALTIVLAPIGRVDQSRYGGGWRVLFRPDDLPADPTIR